MEQTIERLNLAVVGKTIIAADRPHDSVDEAMQTGDAHS
jgi:hypothetical protein